MATQYALPETRAHRAETNAIRKAHVMQRQHDADFLRSLWATYPERKPQNYRPATTPDFAWIKDKKPEKTPGTPEYTALQQAHRERVAAYAAAFRKDMPTGVAIVKTVADWFNLRPEDIKGRSRKGYVVSARMVAIRLLREVKWSNGQSRFSYPQIGSMVGGRDHSTVIHAITVFDDRARRYGEMTEAYEALKDG